MLFRYPNIIFNTSKQSRQDSQTPNSIKIKLEKFRVRKRLQLYTKPNKQKLIQQTEKRR